MRSSNWWIRAGAVVVAAGLQCFLAFVFASFGRPGAFTDAANTSGGSTPPSRAEPIMAVTIVGGSQAEMPSGNSRNSTDRQLAHPVLREIRFEWSDPVQLPVEADESKATSSSAVASGIVPVHCEIHIHQRRDGQVQAIDFGVCTGDAVWQQQLLKNLQRAAGLVVVHSGNATPPVRTLILDTNTLSPEILAEQLGEPSAVVPNALSK